MINLVILLFRKYSWLLFLLTQPFILKYICLKYTRSIHHSDVIMSATAVHFTSTRLFAQLFVQAQLKKIKLGVASFCEGNPSVNSGLPSQRASNAEKLFHLMMSPWAGVATKRTSSDIKLMMLCDVPQWYSNAPMMKPENINVTMIPCPPMPWLFRHQVTSRHGFWLWFWVWLPSFRIYVVPRHCLDIHFAVGCH